MSLVVAFALVAGALVLARALFLGSRLPRTPWWAGDNLVACVLIPALVCSIAFGVGIAVKVLAEGTRIAPVDGIVIAGIAVGAVVLWKVLGRVLPVLEPAPTASLPDPAPARRETGAGVPPASPGADPRRAA